MSSSQGDSGRSRPPWSRAPQGRTPASKGRGHDRSAGASQGPLAIYGLHAVEAVMANPARRIVSLQLTENAENKLRDRLVARGIKAERKTPRELDRALGDEAVHQGALALVEPLAEPTLAELAAATGRAGPLIVLDHVTDPHNVGAVLRSAAVFGASGLVMTRRYSPPLMGALAKSASGALELVPVVLVGNLARALVELAALGVRRLGLDGAATTSIEAVPLDGPLAFVLGAEGKGLRQLTRDTCDALVRIPAFGRLNSLNVSNAAAVALYEAARQRFVRG